MIVTGCLDAKEDAIRQTHPSVLAVTGPQATEEVMAAIRHHLPKPHDPYLGLVPPQGIKLTSKLVSRKLLIISQDTSAYGVDIKYRTGFWQGRPVSTCITELANALGEFGIWVRLYYAYPYPHVDELIPLMTEDKLLHLDIPFQHANERILKLMKRSANSENILALHLVVAKNQSGYCPVQHFYRWFFRGN